MDETLRTRRAPASGGVPDADGTRPEYPGEAVRWMLGSTPGHALDVLELAAGTGGLTGLLLSHGHEVVACDPSAAMLRRLRGRHRSAHVVQAAAERIPLASSSVDVVVVGQEPHRRDTDRVLGEIARVLRPAGTLALVRNRRDETVPWVRRLGRLLGTEPLDDPVEALERSGLYDGIEHRSFRHWQEVFRDTLVGLVESRSAAADADGTERAEVLEKVGELYDDYGRGHDGMLLPYQCHVYRCRVSGLANFRRDQQSPLDDGLLIDFS